MTNVKPCADVPGFYGVSLGKAVRRLEIQIPSKVAVTLYWVAQEEEIFSHLGRELLRTYLDYFLCNPLPPPTDPIETGPVGAKGKTR